MESARTNIVRAPLTPIQPQSFSEEDDRRRLSAAALIAFRSLAKIWKLTGIESAALLGVSLSSWERIKRDTSEGPVLNQDQLTRVSATVGVLKGLRLLFVDDIRDQWPKLANKGPLFQGKTPVESMMEGGIPRMLEVRRHVDALRGSL